MNNENTKKLWNNFPNLYSGKDKSVQDSLIPFGFECQDGWFKIIYDLSEKLEKLIIEDKKTSPDPNYFPIALQVKEKFGGLRFYMTCATDDMENAIADAEKMCDETCEVCGNEGTLTGERWLAVRCKDCLKEFNV